jgi:hypothetical protein
MRFEALFLEVLIADGQHFVDDQDVGIYMYCNGKCQAHVHAARVSAKGLLDEIADSGEFDDCIEACEGLPAAQPQEGGIQEDVFRACQVRVEAGSQLEECGHAALDGDASLGGPAQSADEAQQGALAGAVTANDGHGFAAFHLKRNVLESVKDVGFWPTSVKSLLDMSAQEFGPASVVTEHFRYVFELNKGHIRGNRRIRA